LARIVAAVDYGFPWDRVVAGLKFHRRLDGATPLAQLLLGALPSAPAVDLVLPMPLAPQRLRERGYNQAWEIARRVARPLRLPADAHALLRVRDTAHQMDLPEAERAANVRGAFLVEPARAARLRGRHIALVDDVATTGATAEAAAQALRAAGAAEVSLWVAARTPAPA
jgi:ComF family protein